MNASILSSRTAKYVARFILVFVFGGPFAALFVHTFGWLKGLALLLGIIVTIALVSWVVTLLVLTAAGLFEKKS